MFARVFKVMGSLLCLAFLFMMTGCASNLQRGEKAGLSGDYSAMLEYCKMAAKESTPNPAAFRCIGDAYFHLGKRSKAIDSYLTYLKYVPNDNVVRMQLVRMYFEDGNYMATQVQAEKVLQVDPTNYEAYFYLGEINRINGLCNASRQAYERSLQLNPNYSLARTGLEKLETMDKCKKKKKVYKKIKRHKVFHGGGKALREGEF